MVRYICRRCGRRMGQYTGSWRDPDLGLASLGRVDQEEFIELDDRGNDAIVKILCDHCLPVPWSDNLWYN